MRILKNILTNVMYSLVSYGKDVGIADLLQYLTGPSPNSEEDVKINLVCDTTWLIKNFQWGSNLHWISAVNEEILVNFISHLIDSGFRSVLESLGTSFGLDSLA